MSAVDSAQVAWQSIMVFVELGLLNARVRLLRNSKRGRIQRQIGKRALRIRVNFGFEQET